MLTKPIYDKYLEKGICTFREGKYVQATPYFTDALVYRQKDFQANFWCLRTAVMQGDYLAALQYIPPCKKVDKEIYDQLVKPWQDLIEDTNNNTCIDQGELEKLNIRTDELLNEYQREPSWGFWQLLKFTCIYLILIYIMGSIMGFSIGMIGGKMGFSKKTILYMAQILGFLLDIGIILWMLYKRIPLPPRPWELYQRVKNDIVVLLKQKSFYLYLLLFWGPILLFFTFVYVLNAGNLIMSMKKSFSYQLFKNLSTVIPVILVPIKEELLFRKVLYNTLRKYNKWIGYIVTGIIFAALHAEWRGWVFFKSLIFTWFYERYKTLAAPILVHSFNNALAFLLFAILL